MAPFKDRDEYERWKAARVAGGPEPAPADAAEARPARADPRLILVGAFNAALLPLVAPLVLVLFGVAVGAPLDQGSLLLIVWGVFFALVMAPGGAFLGHMIGRQQPSSPRLLLLSLYASLLPLLVFGLLGVLAWGLREAAVGVLFLPVLLPIYVVVAFDLRRRARTGSPG